MINLFLILKFKRLFDRLLKINDVNVENMNINEIKNLIESLEGNVSFVSNDIFKNYLIRHQSIFEIIKIDPQKFNTELYVIIFYKLKMLIEFCSKAFYIDLKVFIDL